MEQIAPSPNNSTLQNNSGNKIERNKKERKVTFISYKNLINEDLCEPFYYNEEEFKKRKKSMRQSNLKSLLTNNDSINNFQRKKSLINFESVDNKNKNLKVYDEKNMEFNFRRNNNNNYYLNRKYSTIIFNRFHKLNDISEENYKETIVNKWFFCTKMNIYKNNIMAEDKEKKNSKDKKGKKKKMPKTPNKNLKKKSEHKSIHLKKINNNSTSNKKKKKSQEKNKINKISFNDRFKNMPIQEENKTMNDFRKKNVLKLKYTFFNKNKDNIQNKSKSQNKSNKTFYPKLPKKYSKKKEKDNSSSNSNSFSRQRKNNYLFYQINSKGNKYKNNTVISNLKQSEIKEILKKPIPAKKGRNKKELILPKINGKNGNNTNTNFRKRKIKFNPISSSSEIIPEKIRNINTSKNNKGNNMDIIGKNISFIKAKKQKSQDSPSYHIMNYSHKEVENNFINYDIHYCNSALFDKYKKPEIDIKINNTKKIKKTKFPKLNLHLNSSINQNNNEIIKENKKSPLQMQNEYSKTIKRRFFGSFNIKNKPVALKKRKVNKLDEQMLQRYKSSLLAIKEYFNIK